MKIRRFALIVVAALAALSAVTAASAQESTTGDIASEVAGRGRHPIMQILRNVIGITADATGLERTEIVAQLADGKTLAEVISESGGSVDEVKAQILARISERLTSAVENGRITQERADEILATTETRVDTLLNHVFERLAQRDFPGNRRLRPGHSI